MKNFGKYLESKRIVSKKRVPFYEAWISQSKDSKCLIPALNQAFRPSIIGIDSGSKSTPRTLVFNLRNFHFPVRLRTCLDKTRCCIKDFFRELAHSSSQYVTLVGIKLSKSSRVCS
jgi:hypothetical protein